MSKIDFTVKDLQAGVNDLIAVGLVPKGTKLPKELEPAARKFKELVEGIDPETEVIGNEERTTVYNGILTKEQGSGIYEDADAVFPDPEEDGNPPDESPPEEEPKPAAKAANSKGKDMPKTKDKNAAKAPAKKAAKETKAKAGTKESGSTIPTDAFGFRTGSQNHEFGKMLLLKKGCTMAEVRNADWNEKGSPFYNVFRALESEGLAEKDEKRMVATAKARGKK